MADVAQARDEGHRSLLATLAVAAAVISAVTFVALLIGAAAGMEGFDEGEDATLLGNVLWNSFFFGAVLALILGLVAFFVGRSKNRAADTRAGVLAVGWFGAAVLAVVIINILE